MKAPVRWLEEPDALPDELLASMQAYAEVGPSAQDLAQIRAGMKLRSPRVGLKWLATLPVLAALAGVLWAVRTPAPVERAAPAPAVTVPVLPPVPPVEETEEVAPVEPAPVPRPKRVARVVRTDAAAELVLLRRARRLIASDPAAALSLTDEHLRDYPSGVFAEERELLAIEALSQRDRSAAIARARSFASKYPRSVHQARIEAALGAH